MLTKVTNDFIFVKTPYEDRGFVQEQLNGVWSKKENAYRFPKNIHVLYELVTRYPRLSENDQFIELGKSLKKAQQTYLTYRKQDITIDQRLRPYQNTDVNYLKRLPAAGIFNEPRTGKTPTSIILMKELGTKRNLIISPASLIWNWAKEFEKWYPECKIFVSNGTSRKRSQLYVDFFSYKGIKVLIISKDTWKSDHIKLEIGTGIMYDTCFVDEAHYLRNHKTAQSKAIFQIKADRRYALTGTPTVKSGVDVWGILHFLYPTKFPSYWQFVERYWNVGTDWMGHAEIKDIRQDRKQELQELIGFISVQRKRSEVMNWLPDKERTTFHCMMEGKQLKAYQSMLENFFVYLDNGEVLKCQHATEVGGSLDQPWMKAVRNESGEIVDAANILTQITRLRQICLDPKLLGIDAPSAKSKALLEWLDDNREPVVIMSMFTSYFELIKEDIEKLGLKVGMIHGKMSNQEKEDAKVKFQEGKLNVLLCNIISAGVGFTLDRAETILFLDKAWNPSENEQAEDRITPTAQERNHKHTIISMVCANSVDERINNILEAKKSLTEIINEGGREAIKKLLLP
jgi:SNF2 family DNA or RNA helicase